MLTEDSGANNKMSYLCSASGQFSAVEMVSPVGVWMRMASRYLAANRMDIPYLVSQMFPLLFRVDKKPFKSSVELLKS